MRRREFVALLGSAAATWPLAARAQQAVTMRRVGVLYGGAQSDTYSQASDAAFREQLDKLGWIDGRTVHVDYRWGAGDLDHIRQFAQELVSLDPDVLVAITTPATAALQRETRTIPIVFAIVSDPIGSGFVASLAHPGGNITGFNILEASLSGKWLELMHEIAPRVTRVGLMYNPQTAPYAKYYLDTFVSSAAAVSIAPIDAVVDSVAAIEALMTRLGGQPDSGLVIMPDTFPVVHRDTIIALANRYRLPTIYPFSFFTAEGGLLSYGVDNADQYRRAAGYVDRILRGAKPADLPVQQPVKFELVVNTKTAKALGLAVPQSLIAVADDVIE
jgi:putative tryptophan/tyrosine transport system substrate-binding protein